MMMISITMMMEIEVELMMEMEMEMDEVEFSSTHVVQDLAPLSSVKFQLARQQSRIVRAARERPCSGGGDVRVLDISLNWLQASYDGQLAFTVLHVDRFHESKAGILLYGVGQSQVDYGIDRLRNITRQLSHLCVS